MYETCLSHRNPGRKVRFTPSLLLLTIKINCTLPTDCPNALVYADLLVGSFLPHPLFFRMQSLQILVLGGKISRREFSESHTELEERYNSMKFLILFTAKMYFCVEG